MEKAVLRWFSGPGEAYGWRIRDINVPTVEVINFSLTQLNKQCYERSMMKISSKYFLKGVGSVVNLRPQKKYTIRPYSPGKSDSDRLRGDWEKVGQSIQKAMTKYANGNPQA